MYLIRKKYNDLSARKQQLMRNKWMADFNVKSNSNFYYRIDNPNADDLKYFAVVFNCTIDDLIEHSEVTRKARPIEKLIEDQEQNYGLSK